MRACTHTAADALQKHIWLLLCTFFLHKWYIYIIILELHFLTHWGRTRSIYRVNSIITILSLISTELCLTSHSRNVPAFLLRMCTCEGAFYFEGKCWEMELLDLHILNYRRSFQIVLMPMRTPPASCEKPSLVYLQPLLAWAQTWAHGGWVKGKTERQTQVFLPWDPETWALGLSTWGCVHSRAPSGGHSWEGTSLPWEREGMW